MQCIVGKKLLELIRLLSFSLKFLMISLVLKLFSAALYSASRVFEYVCWIEWVTGFSGYLVLCVLYAIKKLAKLRRYT